MPGAMDKGRGKRGRSRGNADMEHQQMPGGMGAGGMPPYGGMGGMGFGGPVMAMPVMTAHGVQYVPCEGYYPAAYPGGGMPQMYAGMAVGGMPGMPYPGQAAGFNGWWDGADMSGGEGQEDDEGDEGDDGEDEEEDFR